MPYCNACGKHMLDDDRFCNSCGKEAVKPTISVQRNPASASISHNENGINTIKDPIKLRPFQIIFAGVIVAIVVFSLSIDGNQSSLRRDTKQPLPVSTGQHVISKKDLEMAIVMDDVETISAWLKNSRANDNVGVMKPLHLAAAAGSNRVLALLLQNGADINAKAGEKNITPLMAAAATGQSTTVGYILKLPNIQVAAEDTEGKTALDYATNGLKEFRGIGYPTAGFSECIQVLTPVLALKTNAGKPSPLQPQDFVLQGIAPGEKFQVKKNMLGTPKKVEKGKFGTIYTYDLMEITVSNNDMIHSVIIDRPNAVTYRGIRPGDDSGKIEKLYGKASTTDSYQSLMIIEYYMKSAPEQILRFAVNKATMQIEYIGVRNTRTIQ